MKLQHPVAAVLILLVGCAGHSTDSGSATGGSSNGGDTGTGGNDLGGGSGGEFNGAGGKASSGGFSGEFNNTGGRLGTAGAESTGGAENFGGAINAGGAQQSTGGVQSTGGGQSPGGTQSAGGAQSTGGQGGQSAGLNIECGQTACNAKQLPLNYQALATNGSRTALACCAGNDGDHCGLLIDGDCVELGQAGKASGECQGFVATAGQNQVTFNGCCKPDGTCGLVDTSIGLGCFFSPSLTAKPYPDWCQPDAGAP